MATKKVYFYQVKVFQVSNEQEVDYHYIKDLLTDIIQRKATRQGGYGTLDLTQNSDPMHIMMDIYRYKNDTLFCRLSKQKPKNSMIQRDYSTKKHMSLLPGVDEDVQGIEVYTYCSLNYNKGILSIVSAQGAPNEKAVCSAVSEYNNKYYIELVQIPNAEAIEAIYFGENSEITKVEIEIPVPTADVMEQVLNWDEDEIVDTVAENALKASIIIKPPTRNSLTKDTEDTQKFIDCIKKAMPFYNKAKVTAKTKDLKTREYDLTAAYFSYPIEIKDYHISGGKRVWYTVEELNTIYHNALKYAYRDNRLLIETITGRMD